MKIKFYYIRWFILAVSFVLLTFGVQIFGFRTDKVYIPTLACPFTFEGIMHSSCYYLIHPQQFFAIPAVLVSVIVSFIIFSIIFGRMLCGFACPFGLLQDILYKIRQLFRIKPIRFSEKHYKWISFVKWVLLAIFLGGFYFGINFCYFCPAMVTTPAFAGSVIPIYLSGFIAIFFVAGSFYKQRLFCTMCPFGLLIGLFSKISFFRLKKDCTACTECGACYEACPMGIKEIYTEREKTDITTHNCLFCGECVRLCPENNGLALSFFRKKFYIATRKDFFKEQGLKNEEKVKKVDLLTKNIDSLLKVEGKEKSHAGNNSGKKSRGA
ncbi:4Fe-4S binding protein [Pseudobacteroides cellulosolvens]|uniref:4Fe-4S ferredoxin, iron-sulpur binding domain-containing protein n=1 Tax=Pseudobacteroides cellulosolvens ATCC 35603 = DSM 2933 TaxID=398512 RepID=A0A0L6JQS1_9FIRM|nr:4Fe-4S binding protein [Pseudobacteroides cellulosolvens]KNY28144.1 4Fe-4S ferredoxin, iron-sulpur binding domain-containing protein [Pseudobacteroides cellulosolvens ATCC 35603 = DSM 2933]